MNFLTSPAAPEALLDIVVIGKKGQIWLQQSKKYNSDWTLIRRTTAKTDVLGYVFGELTALGFIAHEAAILREGATFWHHQGSLRRTPHILVVAEVNYAEAPTETKTEYLGAFPYREAVAMPQRYFEDLRQLADPAIEAMTKQKGAALGEF